MPSNKIFFKDAIAQLHQTAVAQQASTSTLRLKALAEYCVQELAERGLRGAEVDASIPGAGRPKEWDVAWQHDKKYRLAISLKSILRNLGGTVPNRIDDMIGEVANAQMYSPEIVLGYAMVFDISQDSFSPKHGSTWADLLRSRLERLTGRRSPFWSTGMVEAFAFIQFDFSHGAKIITPEDHILLMFDTLVAQVQTRNPGIGMPEVPDG